MQKSPRPFILPLIVICLGFLLSVTGCGGGPESWAGLGPDAEDVYEANRDFERAEAEKELMDELHEQERQAYLSDKADVEMGAAREADVAQVLTSLGLVELFTSTVNLNIRSGPDTSYPKVGLMRKGLRCEVARHNADSSWLEVYCGVSGSGWVSARYGKLETYGDLADSGTLPPPWTLRTLASPSSCPAGCAEQPIGCNVKGNIGYDSREKIYHVPGCEYYDATNVNPAYGERWFCTEQEALTNGWRKAYNCP